MRKSIALLLGLSLATLTACGQAPGNSGAASSDAASAVISEAASDAAPATAETPAASSRDTTTEQRNVLDGFVDFSADTAGRQPEMRPRGGSAGGIPELRRHRRLHRRRLDDRPDPGPARPVGHQLGGPFWPMPKTSPPIQPARPTFYPAPVSPRILPAWF